MDHVQAIRAAEVRLLYEQAPSALIATVINAPILVAVLWAPVSHPFLLSWLLIVLVVVGARYWMRRAYSRSESADAEWRRWRRFYLVGAAANGALWGFAGFFFFTPTSFIYQIFLAIVLVGMVSGGTYTLSSMRGAYLTFLVPSMVPYGVRLIGAGGGLRLAMSGMLVVYITMMAMISGRLHKTVSESLRLRFQNLDLLNEVKQAMEHQELANQELAAEIAEKRCAQEALRTAYEELETRVEERTEKLAQSEKALRDADRRKDEFLAMLGHELRNPLAPIRNALELMQRSGVSDSAAKWGREVIDRQVTHLTRLVDDLLEVSRIAHGKISLQATIMDMNIAVRQAVEGSRPLIDSRHQELSVKLPAEPLWVKGDLVRLSQVISNLLNNASKYSDVGGRIWLNAKASDGWVAVHVRDDGIGIPENVLSHVFELFAQADQSLARNHGGLGIGLTLVKHLIEMHGGWVDAHSEGPGRGAEFSIHVPRQTAPAVQEARAPVFSPGVQSVSRSRVLVVDDSEDVAETLAMLLRQEGYTVEVSLDGAGALAAAATYRPDAILLDIGMPDMDGYEVAEKLRRMEAAKDAIILALTGYGQPDDQARAKAAGFDGHLTKPVDPASLFAVLKAQLTH